MNSLLNNPVVLVVLGIWVTIHGLLLLFSRSYSSGYKSELQNFKLNRLNKTSRFQGKNRIFNYLLIKIFGVNKTFSITKFLLVPVIIIIGLGFTFLGLYLVVNKD